LELGDIGEKMKRKTIKAKISAALSASMVLAMLAPAMPAYAATGNLKFDFHSNVSDSFDGTPEITVSGNIGSTTELASLGTIVVSGDTRTKLPWQDNVTTSGTPVATFLSITDPTTEPTVLGKKWIGDLKLKGYKIKEFRGLPGTGDFPRSSLDVGSIQDQTYFATLESDGTDAMTLNEQHVPDASTSYVPSITATTVGPKNGQHKVLESIQTIPYVIPGYTVTNATITGDGAPKAVQYMGGSIPASKFMSFITSNKDINIKYEYGVDTTKNFAVKVVDKVWQNDSTTPGTYSHTTNTVKSQNNRTANNVVGNVLTNITGITANGNYVDITGSATTPSRYILDPTDPVTVTYDNGTPNGSGQFLSGGNVIPTLIPAVTVAGQYTAITVGSDPAKTISGQVPNQNATITYNYYENPNYYTTVNIKYADKEGNDITNKVVTEHSSLFTDISTVVPPAAPAVGTLYKDGSSVFMRVNTTQANYNVPVPVMNDYISTGTDSPTISPDNSIDWSSSYRFINGGGSTPTPAQEGWGASHPFYQVSIDRDGDGTADTPTKNGDVTVTYTVDPTKVAQVAVVGVGNGQLLADRGQATEHEYGTLASDVLQLSRESVTSSGDYSLTIKEADLPSPVPAAGYKFMGWKYGTTDVNPLPYTISGIPGTQGSIVLTAKFDEDPNLWNTYNLVTGDSHVQLLNGSTAKIANTDASGTPRANIPFSDIDAFTQEATGGVSVDSGYVLEWRDQHGNVLTSATDISGMNGQTFTAFAVSSTPAAVYTPTVNGTLDNTGAPAISVDPLSPAPLDPRLNYVVTDSSGNVVAVVPGSQVITNGGNIKGNFLTPGNAYNVAVALSTASVTVGSPIPSGATDIGTTSSATIPVAPTPLVAEDSSNPGRASITVSPAAPNTEYALVDDNGNEVYPFTAPDSGNKVTFGNLDPGRVYHIVPRAVGSNETPAQRQSAGADLPVNTNNLGLTVNTFDVTVVANNAPLPTSLKVNGQTKSNLNALKGLSKGMTVEILAQPLDNASNTFVKWEAISGITISAADATNSRLTFTMPNKPVKVQAMYDDGTDWDNNLYTDNIGSGKIIGSVNPVINDTGRFRVVINKNSVPTNVKDLIASTLTDNYTSVFLMDIVVQKLDTATGNWVDYTSASGDIALDTTVETGALISTRDYMFHELATSSNAVTALSGDFEHPGTSYPGQFDITLKSGKSYVFGYTSPATHSVKVRDNRDNSLITDLTLRDTEVVQDKASLYSHKITGDYIDNNGITWHYEGLSTDKDTYQAYDPTTRVTEDMTIYVFYSNDKDARKKADSNLRAAIQNAKEQLSKITDPAKIAALQAAIDAAQAVLDRVNRKSSTAELKAALDALNQAVKDAGGKVYVPEDDNNKGGGGRHRGGGGSSGGGTGSAKGKSTGLRVGQDGNWELLNPAEATANPDSSKWVFNLASGGKVKGWAYLSYTYQGQTKSEWYHFGDDNTMNTGWLVDGGKWYYLSMDHNGFYGEMVKGWHFETQDNRWYYLNPNNGSMHTDWLKDGNEFYYLNPVATEQTWFYDSNTERWNYGDRGARSLGSMFQNENTPDGYHVNENGAWR